MEVDERLRWMECRVTSSLAPRPEDLTSLLTNGETRNVFLDFYHNEEQRSLFVFRNVDGRLRVTVGMPTRQHGKAIVFVKYQQTGIVSKERISDELMYSDMSENPISDLARITRHVYMPMVLGDAAVRPPSPAVGRGRTGDASLDAAASLTSIGGDLSVGQAQRGGEILAAHLTAALQSHIDAAATVVRPAQATVAKRRTASPRQPSPVDGTVAGGGGDRGRAGKERLADSLHRLMVQADMAQASMQGKVLLPLPSAECLYSVLESTKNISAVTNILESVVLSWQRQIKTCLEIQPGTIRPFFGSLSAGTSAEYKFWKDRMSVLESIDEQLHTMDVAQLEKQLSIVSSRHGDIVPDLREKVDQAMESVGMAATAVHCFLPCLAMASKEASSLRVNERMGALRAIVHSAYLVWGQTDYYHEPVNFTRLMALVTNDVLACAQACVKSDIFQDRKKGLSEICVSMDICAQFRGTYVNKKKEADAEDERRFLQDRQEFQATLPPREEFPWTIPVTARQSRLARQDRTERRRQERRHDDYVRDNCYATSPWPDHGDVVVFARLNAYLSRCGDLCDILATAEHFQELADVDGVFPAQQNDLAAHVWSTFDAELSGLRKGLKNPLDVDTGNEFASLFDNFRQVVKSLEGDVSRLLLDGLEQCKSSVTALRLLGLFRGFISRESCQKVIQNQINKVLTSCQVQTDRWQSSLHLPDDHAASLLPVASSALSLRGGGTALDLDAMSDGGGVGGGGGEHTYTFQLQKLTDIRLSAGETCALLRAAFPELRQLNASAKLLDTSLARVLHTCESRISQLKELWQQSVDIDVMQALKQNVLVLTPTGSGALLRASVNLNAHLVAVLHEALQLSKEPLCVPLPPPLAAVSSESELTRLRYTANRLHECAAQYNELKSGMSSMEQSLFMSSFVDMERLIREGSHSITWQSSSLADFLEQCTSIISKSLYRKWSDLRCEMQHVKAIIDGWSSSTKSSDIFSLACRQGNLPLEMVHAGKEHGRLQEEFLASIEPASSRIQQRIANMLQIIGTTTSSPEWVKFVSQVDADIAIGLRNALIFSMKAMEYTLEPTSPTAAVLRNELGFEERDEPFLKVELVLDGGTLHWRPYITHEWSKPPVGDLMLRWLDDIMARPGTVSCIAAGGDFAAVSEGDEDIDALLERIKGLLQKSPAEAQEIKRRAGRFSCLWENSVFRAVRRFVGGDAVRHGNDRSRTPSQAMRSKASRQSTTQVADGRSLSSLDTSGLMGVGEQRLIAYAEDFNPETTPFLDDFEEEIILYEKTQEQVLALPKSCRYGWLQVDLSSLIICLRTLCLRWLHAYKEYLSQKCSSWLQEFAKFLSRVEPIVDDVTGDELHGDTFMNIILIFNEVSTQQRRMDEMFTAVHRGVRILHAHNHFMATQTEADFESLPTRFANLKRKMSLAKQKLGPRLRQNSEHLVTDLKLFGKQCEALQTHIRQSPATTLGVSPGDARPLIDEMRLQLKQLEAKSKDLIELQDLLERSVVNFQMLPDCDMDIQSVDTLWQTASGILSDQHTLRTTQWKLLSVDDVRSRLDGQTETLQALSARSKQWPLFCTLVDHVEAVRVALPVVEKLSSPAMRQRHWKQVVRFVRTDIVDLSAAALPDMELGDLMKLRLHDAYEENGKELYNPSDLANLVSKAEEEVSVEDVIRVLESVWLSRNFSLRTRSRNRQNAISNKTSARSSRQGSAFRAKGLRGPRSSGRSNASDNTAATAGPSPDPVSVLVEVESIFETLENHHSLLSRSATATLSEDFLKWQRRLQTIETVAGMWMRAQEIWDELEDIFATSSVAASLAEEARIFFSCDRQYRQVMTEVSANANIYHCTRVKGRVEFFTSLQEQLNRCEMAVLQHVTDLRQQLPSLHFLCPRDVLHLVSSVSDVTRLERFTSKLLPAATSIIVAADTPNTQDTALPSSSSAQSPRDTGTLAGRLSVIGRRSSAYRSDATSTVSSGTRSLAHTRILSFSTDSAGGRFSERVRRGGAGAEADRCMLTESICGIVSHLGEKLQLNKPVPCKPVGTGSLLVSLVVSSTSSLEEKVATVYAMLSDRLQGDVHELTNDVLVVLDTVLRHHPTQVTSTAMKMLLDSLLDKVVAPSTPSPSSSSLSSSSSSSSSPVDAEAAAAAMLREHGQFVHVLLLRLLGVLQYVQRQVQLSTLGSMQESQARARLRNRAAWRHHQADATDADAGAAMDKPAWESQRRLLFRGEVLKMQNILAVVMSHKRCVAGLLKRKDGCHADDGEPRRPKRVTQAVAPAVEGGGGGVKVVVKVGDNTSIPYAYHYLGSCTVHPVDDVMMTTLADAVTELADNPALSLQGEASAVDQCVEMLSWTHGHQLNVLPCNAVLLAETLISHLEGMSSHGSILYLRNADQLSPQLTNVLGEFLHVFLRAQQRGWSGFMFLDRQVVFTKGAQCIASSSLSVHAATANPTGMEHFGRSLRVAPVDVDAQLEFMLCGRGFQHAAELAPRLASLMTAHVQVTTDGKGPQREAASEALQTRSSQPSSSSATQHVPHLWHGVIEQAAENLIGHREQLVANGAGGGVGLENPVKTTLEDELRVMAVAVMTLLLPAAMDKDEEWHARCLVRRHLGIDDDDDDDVDIADGDFCDAVAESQFAKVAASTVSPGQRLEYSQSQMSRVQQLLQLLHAYTVVSVIGSAAVGKTTCIRLAASVCNHADVAVTVQWIAVSGMTTAQLIGYQDAKTRIWTDGVLTRTLRAASRMSPVVQQWIVLDGKLSENQQLVLKSLVMRTSAVSGLHLPNGEVIYLSTAVRIILENTETTGFSTDCIAPHLVVRLGDVGWRTVLSAWLGKQHDVIVSEGVLAPVLLRSEYEAFRGLCLSYAERCLRWLADKELLRDGFVCNELAPLEMCEVGMVKTFSTIMECTLFKKPRPSHWQGMTAREVLRFTSYAATWAYGSATLFSSVWSSRFSDWWREIVEKDASLPPEGEVFDLAVMLQGSRYQYKSWARKVPRFTKPATGISGHSIVQTARLASLHYLMSLLADANCPLALVGLAGVGKATLLEQYTSRVSLGDLCDTGCLNMDVTRCTTAGEIWDRLKKLLQWRFGHTYAPKQKKRMILVLEDLQKAEASFAGNGQSAFELARQLLGQNGCHSPSGDRHWHVFEAMFPIAVVTLPPPPPPPSLSMASQHQSAAVESVVPARLLHHTVVLPVAEPKTEELFLLYHSLLKAHFAAEPHNPMQLSYNTTALDLRVTPRLLESIARTTVDLHRRLNQTFQPQPWRRHYNFTMTTVTAVISSLHNHLPPTATGGQVLLLWMHECHWLFCQHLSTALDRERCESTLTKLAKIHFTRKEALELVLSGNVELFRCPLAISLEMSTSQERLPTPDGKRGQQALSTTRHHSYAVVDSVDKLREDVGRALLLHNEKFPSVIMPLHKANLRMICRIQHLLAQPQSFGHVVLVATGNPAMPRRLVSLVAFMNDATFVTMDTLTTGINENLLDEEWRRRGDGDAASSALGTDSCIYDSEAESPDRLLLFNVLRDLCERGGVENKPFVVLLTSDDVPTEQHMALVHELMCSGRIEHWYSAEQRVRIVNNMRATISKQGLDYSDDVAWETFHANIRRNVRVVLTFTSCDSEAFHMCSRHFSGLLEGSALMVDDPWTEDTLLDVATHMLQEGELFASETVDGMAHMCVEIHSISLATLNAEAEICSRPLLQVGYNEMFESFVASYMKLYRSHWTLASARRNQLWDAVQRMKEVDRRQAERRESQLDGMALLENLAMTRELVLAQIGQDLVVVSEYNMISQKHKEYIRHLRKKLPEYEMASEKSKRDIVQLKARIHETIGRVSIASLQELRLLSPVPGIVEDVLAVVIILTKSVTADVTWSRGCKRLLSNAERFLELLSAFAERSELGIPAVDTIAVHVAKGTFNDASLRKQCTNKAIAELQTWASEVTDYHELLREKDRPYEVRIADCKKEVAEALTEHEEMTKKIDELNTRLTCYYDKIEFASLKVCEQKTLVKGIEQERSVLENFLKMMNSERETWSGILERFEQHNQDLFGSMLLTAAAGAYLQHGVGTAAAQLLVASRWPECTHRRGYPAAWPYTECGLPWYLAHVVADSRTSREPHTHLEPGPKTDVVAIAMTKKPAAEAVAPTENIVDAAQDERHVGLPDAGDTTDDTARSSPEPESVPMPPVPPRVSKSLRRRLTRELLAASELPLPDISAPFPPMTTAAEERHSSVQALVRLIEAAELPLPPSPPPTPLPPSPYRRHRDVNDKPAAVAPAAVAVAAAVALAISPSRKEPSLSPPSLATRLKQTQRLERDVQLVHAMAEQLSAAVDHPLPLSRSPSDVDIGLPPSPPPSAEATDPSPQSLAAFSSRLLTFPPSCAMPTVPPARTLASLSTAMSLMMSPGKMATGVHMAALHGRRFSPAELFVCSRVHAAMMGGTAASLHKWPLIVDADGAGAELARRMEQHSAVERDVALSPLSEVLDAIQTAMVQGIPLLLVNITAALLLSIRAVLVRPLASIVKDSGKSGVSVQFCGRHATWHKNFRLYMTWNPNAKPLPLDVRSHVTLVGAELCNALLCETMRNDVVDAVSQPLTRLEEKLRLMFRERSRKLGEAEMVLLKDIGSIEVKDKQALNQRSRFRMCEEVKNKFVAVSDLRRTVTQLETLHSLRSRVTLLLTRLQTLYLVAQCMSVLTPLYAHSYGVFKTAVKDAYVKVGLELLKRPEVPELENPRAVVSRFLHAMNKMPWRWQQEMKEKFTRHVFACITRAYSPLHQQLAAFLFASLSHVYDVKPVSDFLEPAEELSLLLEGSSCFMPVHNVLPKLQASSATAPSSPSTRANTAHMPSTLQAARLLRLLRLERSRLAELPGKIVTTTTNREQAQEALDALCECLRSTRGTSVVVTNATGAVLTEESDELAEATPDPAATASTTAPGNDIVTAADSSTEVDTVTTAAADAAAADAGTSPCRPAEVQVEEDIRSAGDAATVTSTSAVVGSATDVKPPARKKVLKKMSRDSVVGMMTPLREETVSGLANAEASPVPATPAATAAAATTDGDPDADDTTTAQEASKDSSTKPAEETDESTPAAEDDTSAKKSAETAAEISAETAAETDEAITTAGGETSDTQPTDDGEKQTVNPDDGQGVAGTNEEPDVRSGADDKASEEDESAKAAAGTNESTVDATDPTGEAKTADDSKEPTTKLDQTKEVTETEDEQEQQKSSSAAKAADDGIATEADSDGEAGKRTVSASKDDAAAIAAKESLAKLGLPTEYTPMQRLLLRQLVSTPGDFAKELASFVEHSLCDRFLASPPVKLNDLLQLGKPIIIVRPPTEELETAITELLKTATKVYRQSLVKARVSSASLLPTISNKLDSILRQGESVDGKPKPIFQLQCVDLAPTSWLCKLEGQLRGVSQEVKKPLPGRRPLALGCRRQRSALSRKLEAFQPKTLLCPIVMTCSPDANLPHSLVSSSTVVSWQHLKLRPAAVVGGNDVGSSSNRSNTIGLPGDICHGPSAGDQLLRDISRLGPELRRRDWFLHCQLAFDSTMRHTSASSPAMARVSTPTTAPSASGDTGSSSAETDSSSGRRSSSTNLLLPAEEAAFGLVKPLGRRDALNAWLVMLQEHVPQRLDARPLQAIVTRTPLGFAMHQETTRFNNCLVQLKRGILEMRGHLQTHALGADDNASVGAGDVSAEFGRLVAGLVPIRWKQLWHGCVFALQPGGGIAQWLKGVRRQNELLDSWSRHLCNADEEKRCAGGVLMAETGGCDRSPMIHWECLFNAAAVRLALAADRCGDPTHLDNPQ